jgi:hypothetical protein
VHWPIVALSDGSGAAFSLWVEFLYLSLGSSAKTSFTNETASHCPCEYHSAFVQGKYLSISINQAPPAVFNYKLNKDEHLLANLSN